MNGEMRYESGDEDEFEEMDTSSITEENSINVLIIGETGVGKSTFINAFGNYLNFDSLDSVEDGHPFIFIPTKFTVTDEDYNVRVVTIGADENESGKLGSSCTQDPRTYTFPISGGQKFVNLIDTPGIGDTRGIDQDTINCEKILNYIAPLKVIHGICFLLKPNSSRITVIFEFCMKQILSRLEKSASNNLLFVFTNTRATCYRPGETLPCLKGVLDDIKKKPPFVEIPLSKKNIFCLDNEAFRYLAAVQNGVKFTPKEKQYFEESWVKSTEESWRMILYIMGDAENQPLQPHTVANTLCINQARNLINQLKQPMADIAQLIQDKLRAIQKHKEYLELESLSIQDMQKNLFIPVIDIETKELKQPVTVCTSSSCSKIYKVRNVDKWHYSQRCHNPCYLKNVPRQMVGAPELLDCWAMSGTQTCTQCKCNFLTHMHIYYESVTVDRTIEDDNIKSNIDTKEKVFQEKERVIRSMEIMKQELETEHKVIIQYTAKFANFLQRNAITPYNDVYKAYIEYLIDREKSLGDDADYNTIKYYIKMQAEYEEAKLAFDKALGMISQNSDLASGKALFNSPDEIEKSVEQLFKLKHTGKKIKELYTSQQNARKSEYKQNAVVVSDVRKTKTKNKWYNFNVNEWFFGPSKSKYGETEPKVNGKTQPLNYHQNQHQQQGQGKKKKGKKGNFQIDNHQQKGSSYLNSTPEKSAPPIPQKPNNFRENNLQHENASVNRCECKCENHHIGPNIGPVQPQQNGSFQRNSHQAENEAYKEKLSEMEEESNKAAAILAALTVEPPIGVTRPPPSSQDSFSSIEDNNYYNYK